MEKYTLQNDVKVFGFQVKSFPEGLGDAFDSLAGMIHGDKVRSYFGICEMRKNQLVYLAAAEERNENEARIYNCERFIIEKGDYLTISLTGWRSKTDSIKGLFDKLHEHPDTDHFKPIVEWYKDDHEMLCMVRMRVNQE